MRFFIALFLFFGLFSAPALAVPPPDFLFNVGAQLAQIFAVVAIFLSAVFGASWQFMKVFFGGFRRSKHYKLFIFGILVFILAISFGFAWWYQQYQQQQAYNQWLNESKAQQTDDTILDTQQVIFSQQISSQQFLTQQTQISELSTTTIPISQNNSEATVVLKDLPLVISNQEFQKIIENDPNVFVLDGREDEEYNLGHFPGSIHIRFADLLSTDWEKLPKDKVIYVFCWSGIRGKELASFLRTKNLPARYLEDGANGWVKAAGKWEGEIAFSSKYKAEQYSRLFTKEEIQKQLKSGTVLVDTRPQDHYGRHHVAGSLNIAIIYTSSPQLEEKLASVPKGKPVITICDDFVSCFDAKITGIKLELRGHTFLGRYNKPWEY